MPILVPNPAGGNASFRGLHSIQPAVTYQRGLTNGATHLLGGKMTLGWLSDMCKQTAHLS